MTLRKSFNKYTHKFIDPRIFFLFKCGFRRDTNLNEYELKWMDVYCKYLRIL